MKRARIITIACIVVVVLGAVFYGASRYAGRGGTARPGHGQPPPPDASSPSSAESVSTQEEGPTIEIPLEKQQLIGVRTAIASVIPLRRAIRTVGRIEYDERRLTTVNTKVEGWIEKLHVNYTGTYVKKGDRIADIYSPELWATQQEFINLVRWAKRTEAKGSQQTGSATRSGDDAPDLNAMLSEDASTILDAARRRLKLWDISDEQIARIERSETPMRALTVYSPVSGYVIQKYAVQGMRAMAGEKLFDVSDLSIVWVVADIYENEFPLVKVGETARIRLSSLPGRELSSRIEFMSPELSGQTRTIKVRFSIPNPGGQLRPQMFADVEMMVDLGRKLAVPDEAVIDTGLRKIVYVDKGDGYFEPRQVTTGIRAEKMIEVVSGLTAGEKVASSANFLIDSEAKLKGIEAAGAAAGGAAQKAAPPADSKPDAAPVQRPKQDAPPAGAHRH